MNHPSGNSTNKDGKKGSGFSDVNGFAVLSEEGLNPNSRLRSGSRSRSNLVTPSHSFLSVTSANTNGDLQSVASTSSLHPQANGTALPASASSSKSKKKAKKSKKSKSKHDIESNSHIDLHQPEPTGHTPDPTSSSTPVQAPPGRSEDSSERVVFSEPDSSHSLDSGRGVHDDGRTKDKDRDKNTLKGKQKATSLDPKLLLTHTKVGKDLVEKEVSERVKKEDAKKLLIKRRRFWFPFGIVLGLLLGLLLLARSHPLQLDSLPSVLTLLLEKYDLQTIADHLQQLSLRNLTDRFDFDFDLRNINVSGWEGWDWRGWDFEWARLEFEWENFFLRGRIPELWKLNNDGREYQVGEQLAARGLSANHPVILIPGIISTGLESWSTDPTYRSWFRQKVWGGFPMLAQVTFNSQKWLAQLMLDPETGLDPPGIKIRAAQGFDAASSFLPGYYWIWSKIIENLSVLGYEPGNLKLAAYDWRLSFSNMEERDGWMGEFKWAVERMRKKSGKKVALVAHSMGALVVLYFFKWAESPDHGGGGPRWVEDNIDSFTSICGTFLGVPKSMTAFLSGEMKDTVELNPAGAFVLEKFLSRQERARLFRSWAGSASMWVKGGDSIWGNLTHAPDDREGAVHSHGRFFTFRPDSSLSTSSPLEESPSHQIPIVASAQPLSDGDMSNSTVGQEALSYHAAGVVHPPETRITPNMTMADAATWVLQHVPGTFQRMLAGNFSFGMEKDEKQLELNDLDPTKWSNPLESRLPNAPSMKMYCVYGHGKETERSYWYARGDYEYDESFADTSAPQCFDANLSPDGRECDINKSPRAPLDMPLSRRNWIDWEWNDENAIPQIRNGVQFGEGDGTVSLLSLGTMCAEGWKREKYNPAGIKVTTIELPHNPTPGIPRGGANTSDHVDILGATQLNEIVLKVAAGIGDEVKDQYVSNIREYVKKMQWD